VSPPSSSSSAMLKTLLQTNNGSSVLLLGFEIMCLFYVWSCNNFIGWYFSKGPRLLISTYKPKQNHLYHSLTLYLDGIHHFAQFFFNCIYFWYHNTQLSHVQHTLLARDVFIFIHP
jgi:hypothetical protein